MGGKRQESLQRTQILCPQEVRSEFKEVKNKKVVGATEWREVWSEVWGEMRLHRWAPGE